MTTHFSNSNRTQFCYCLVERLLNRGLRTAPVAGCVWRSLDLKLNNLYFMLFDICAPGACFKMCL